MSEQTKHAGGNWSIGTQFGAIVTDAPYEDGVRGYDAVEHYGGYMIAESVSPSNRPLLSAAKDLYEALGSMVCSACEYPVGYDDHPVDCAYCAKARKAIAKARGASFGKTECESCGGPHQHTNPDGGTFCYECVAEFDHECAQEQEMIDALREGYEG